MREAEFALAAPGGDLVARRIALGQFLRARRGGISPESVAVRSSGRRRVSGLRRDEVAALAEIGVSWYTLLEQGRVENVSQRTLSAIARALRLDPVEREHLATLAGASFAELRVNTSPPSAELMAFVRAFADGPAFIVSPHLDVIAANDDARLMYGIEADGVAPNLVRIMLERRAMRDVFIAPAWDEILTNMIGHLRYGGGMADGARYAHLIAALRRHPEFEARWANAPVSQPPFEQAVIAFGADAPRTVSVSAFTCFACPTYTLVFNRYVGTARDDVSRRIVPTGTCDPHRAQASAAVRRELGAFLRSRRESVGPHEIGLTPIGRRHAKGLRRSEVAERAQIGVSWYAMLEQGRVENVSPRTLRSVADALMLDHRERLYLERLAFASFSDYDGAREQPDHAFLREIATFPGVHAHFHDAQFNLLAWNTIADELYGLARFERPNLLEIMALDPHMREVFVEPNWTESVRRMVAHYRFSNALFDDREPASRIARLAAASPPFAAAVARRFEVSNPAVEAGRLRYPDGVRSVTVLVLAPTRYPHHTLILKPPLRGYGSTVRRSIDAAIAP